MKRTLIIYLVLCAMIGCTSKTNSRKNIKEVEINSIKPIVEIVDTIIQERFINFPIPELDSIFKFSTSSGIVANSPSKNFYNPNDLGIFVFYILNYRKEYKMGYLTTHTYRKPKYGWSETDKDQTFILLRLEELPIRRQKTIKIRQKIEIEKAIKIGQKIEIGTSIENLKQELGNPIYVKNSSIVFLGKNKIIGKFRIKNNEVKSIVYGHFNLNDSIFDLDSIALRSAIEEKLKGVK